MPRRKAISKRKITPDPKYRDKLVAKFINGVMRNGKKSNAERIVYGAFQSIEQKKGEEALKIFKKALDNVKPTLEVKSRRVGGATYQVPVEVRNERRMALAMRWIITYSLERGEKHTRERLAAEILDASENRGGAVRKKEEVHKMAEANRAFAHYRW
ncbi:MAG TPA: 30S ribosomal protein S7 [Myxococcota bacterium]|jgi:small subunit ribosomal protein S7|nr:30S ribosomal protein S7 [Myxococcota bacterium]